MNAHTPPPGIDEQRLRIYCDMEGPICDLARLALAVSIVADNVRDGLRSGATVYRSSQALMENMESELELLFAFVDDAKDGAMALRQGYYGRAVL